MPYINIDQGISIKVPTRGTTNYDETMRTDTYIKISEHDHTGSGKGLQLTAAAFADNAITFSKIQGDNNEWFTWRNQADTGDVNAIRVNINDEVEFGVDVASASFEDDGFIIQDNADNTKKLAFECSGITTATTRTLTVPDATDTIAVLAAAQTLTNKSIDSDNNTITNIVNADIKAAAAIALDKLAATTASRALVSDGSGFVSASSVTATELGYVSGVTSAIQTQLDAKLPLTGGTLTGDLNLDNEQELRLSENDANGANYVGFKAAATLAGDQIWTLPTADGSASTFLQTDGSGNLTFASASSGGASIASKTTTYTATTSDDVILADTSGGGWTLTLYAASGNSGKRLKVIKTTSDTNVLTIDGNASETIRGATTFLMHTQNQSVTLLCDGTNWQVENHFAQTPWADDGAITIGATTTAPTKAASPANDRMKWRRDGKDLIADLIYNHTAGGVGGGSGDYTFKVVPTGYTIDTSIVTAYATVEGAGAWDCPASVVGSAAQGDSAAGGGSTGIAVLYDNTSVRIFLDTNVVGNSYAPMTQTTMSYSIQVRVPISGWEE